MHQLEIDVSLLRERDREWVNREAEGERES